MWGGWHSVSLVMGFFFQQKNKTKGAIDFGLCGWQFGGVGCGCDDGQKAKVFFFCVWELLSNG